MESQPLSDPSGTSKGSAFDGTNGCSGNEDSISTNEPRLSTSSASNQSIYPPLTTEEERAIEQLWFGLIPVVFSLAKKDVASVSKPDEIYLMCPRSSYIPLVAADSVGYFREYTAVIDATGSAMDSSVWFEDEQTGAPLKSHLPAGVLHDALASGSVPPWRITVHFSKYPVSLLVRAGSAEAVEKRYFQSLKQALYLMQGNVRHYTSMSLQEQQVLWKSVKESDWSAVQQLYTTLLSNVAPRFIPVRCVVVPSPSASSRASGEGGGVGAGLRVLQRPIAFAKARKGRDMAAVDAAAVDDYDNSTDDTSRPHNNTGSLPDFPLVTLAEAVLAIAYPNSKLTVDDLRRRHGRVIVQGLDAVPWDADVHALWRMCAHPDMFLYVCIFET